MSSWMDVWHLAVSIVVRQPPFAQVMLATGAVFVAVMALEGLRSSLVAIWRAHKHVPPATRAIANPAAGLALKNNSAPSQSRFTAAAARRPKALTLSPRQFRSPRPKIRRHAKLEFGEFSMLPENAARAALELGEAL